MPFPRSPELMSSADSALLIIDVQEKLIEQIPGYNRVIWHIRKLIDAARILNVPVAGTEQYPEGLGPTEESIKGKLEEFSPKRDFSCTECEDIFTAWQAQGVLNVVLAGIEAHVCVLHTALDLMAAGFNVHVVIDAIGSRSLIDRDTAITRMGNCGATLSTTETAIFEWTGTAKAPEFSQISKLIRRQFQKGRRE